MRRILVVDPDRHLPSSQKRQVAPFMMAIEK